MYRRPETAPDPAFGGLRDGWEAAPVKGLEQKRTNLHEKDDHPKNVLGFRQSSMRGLAKCDAELKLVCMALNLRRMCAMGAS